VKKLFAIIFAIAILGTLFLTACDTGNAGETVTPAPDTGSQETGTQETPPPPPPPIDPGYPTLTWLVPGTPQADMDLVNAAISEYTREHIGVNLELQIIDWGAFEERINLNLAAQTEFDLMFVGFMNTYNAVINNGGAIEIGSLLEEHAPDLLATLPDYALRAVQTERGIFAIPNIQIMAFGGGWYIQDWIVEEHGIDLNQINSIDDLYPVLEIIRDNHPEYVPVMRTNASSFRPDVRNDIGVQYFSINGSLVFFDSSTGRAITYYQIPGARESVARSHEWYLARFYRSDLATNIHSGGGDELSREGRYAVMSTVYKPGVIAEIFNETGRDFSFMFRENLIMGHSSPLETMIGVSATSRHPVEAVKFINLVHTSPTLYNLISFGIEGVHYERVGTNHIRLFPDSRYNPNTGWMFGNQFISYLMEGQEDDTWIETARMNAESIQSPLIGIFFDIENIRTELAQADRVQQEFIDALANTGLEHPDTWWDDYIEQLYAAGLEAILAEYQRQIDEFLASRP